MPMVTRSLHGKVQFEAGVFEVAISFGGVAREGDPFSKWDDQSLLVQFACFEVHRVNEEVARIAEVRDGGGEETPRAEDGVVVPAFNAEALQGLEGVEAGRLKVAIEDGLARPADLGEFAIGLEQGTGLGQFGLHGVSRFKVHCLSFPFGDGGRGRSLRTRRGR
jgi:hypothetical protein